MMRAACRASARHWDGDGWSGIAPALPEETAVALSYNGTTHAVMMATPSDLEDFGLGFSLAEGVVRIVEEVTSIAVVAVPGGVDVQMTLDDSAAARLGARRRHMAGPVGCGLCGIDSIAEALTPVRPVRAPCRLTPPDVSRAMALLPRAQVLHDTTHAAHAAAFFTPTGGLVAVREDVGRHNALDKLAGALLRGRQDAGTGAVLLTCRVSVDMVQKAAALGTAVVIATSAPTAHAVRLAQEAGLTLIGQARAGRFTVFARPERIDCQGRTTHVA